MGIIGNIDNGATLLISVSVSRSCTTYVGQRNQLCNPAICFATYTCAYPIAQLIYVYVSAYVYLGPYAVSPARCVSEIFINCWTANEVGPDIVSGMTGYITYNY